MSCLCVTGCSEFFSGQHVPLRTFSCARHSLSTPVSLDPDGAADHKHSQPRFLPLLFACRQTQNKTSIQCNLARYELITTYRTLSYCIRLYRIFSFYTGRLEVITYKSTLLERIFRELSESKIHRIKMNLSVVTVCFGMRLFLHRHARPASRSLLPSSYLC